MSVTLKAAKCPDAALALKNLVAVSPEDFPGAAGMYLSIRNAAGEHFFSAACSEKMKQGTIGFANAQRNWAKLALGDALDVNKVNFGVQNYLGEMTISIEFAKKGTVSKDRFDTSKLAATVLDTFNRTVFCSNMQFVFAFAGESGDLNFKATVAAMKGMDSAGGSGGKAVGAGVLNEGTKLTFTTAEGSAVTLSGKNAGGGAQQSMFDPGWKFEDMGIGGLGKQFSEMFRRAFVSRIFPPEVVEKLGMPHTKGMMLYGPPGTGKTLMARKIGQMLRGKEPKVVNGPEIMSKFVGESEENVRKLFADAEAEQQQRGENSGLHIIIFDEIDAICKERGSTSGGTGVADSVVNQLLSKIDGVEALNNVFLIGMTNRLDMIDEALLRPGRFEIKLQIGLPDEEGRAEIFKIHTAKQRDNGYLAADVDLAELAARAKNFSGAEIAGLIRSGVSFATERCLKAGSTVEIDQDAIDNLKVTMSDFNRALAEVKPAFGADEEQFTMTSTNGIIEWDTMIGITLDTGKLLVKQAEASSRTPMVSLLLSGPPGAGTTSLAATIAQSSGFPYIKVISPDKMVGLTVTHRISRIKKIFDDAYKSVRSVVVVDDIERLIDFVEIGLRFSNDLLQALLVLIKKTPPPGHKMLVIATTSQYEVLRKMGLVAQFSKVQHVNYVEQAEQVMAILQELGSFGEAELATISAALSGRQLTHQSYGDIPICIGVKKVYMLAEMSLQAEDIADTFLYAMFEECKANVSSH